MKRFLRETWELWYWAMFCPSRLQQRMNEWAPAEEKDGLRSDTKFEDILGLRTNSRFISQYLLILFFFSLPLALVITIYKQPQDWLLLPLGILTAYGVGFLFLPLGLQILLLSALVYFGTSKNYFATISKALSPLPTIQQLVPGLAISTGSLVFTLLLGVWLLNNRIQIVLTRNLIAVGGTLSVLFGSWLVTQSWPFVLTISIGTGIFLISYRSRIKSTYDAVIVVVGLAIGLVVIVVVVSVFAVVTGVAGFLTFIFAAIIAGAIAGNMAGGMVGAVAGAVADIMAVGLAIIIVGMLTLPLPIFLIVCWLILVSISATYGKWLGIVFSAILVGIGFQHMGLGSLLIAFVSLLSYYRLLPDYYVLLSISFLSSIPLISRLSFKPLQLLYLLPPHSTELLWLPIPNHDRILAAAFRTDASATLATFQKMQASPLPGLKVTIKDALPQIIADQLTAIKNIAELIAIATPEHPFLPLLAPALYQPSNLEIEPFLQELSSITNSTIRRWFIITSILGSIITGTIEILTTYYLATIIGSITGSVIAGIMISYLADNWSSDIEDGADINKLLPRLQTVAKDVDAALKAGSSAIRERGLEKILNNLGLLQAQVPGLLLKPRAIKRWQPVLLRWQRVIELELQEEQQQSQDELLNPFQYGNPLRSDRANLFRGRQKFADEIVRLILDRNRPTLVLHGPRRCGKTSFLYNLPRLLPSSLLPVYLDLQSSAITTDEAAFCQGLVRAIHRDSRSQGIELPITPTRQEFLETPYITLEDWLEQALPKLGERRLLLNLDEFEKIGTAINEKRLSLNLFDELRHLIQHYDSLAFLFSGVQTLDELGPNWSSYFISVVPLEMTYLEPDEAESLLTNPDPEFALCYDRGIVEEIIQLTRCQPYLLQLLGSALVTQANLNHTQLVTPDLLQAAIPEAFTNGEPYFTNVWTEFTGNNPAEIIAGQEFLLELANGLAPGHSQDLTDAAIGRLRRYHAIEQTDNGYVFEVPLLERWVRERAVKNNNY